MAWPPAVLAHFATREGFAPHWFLWVTAREFATGNPVSLGLWTGDDHRDFAPEGVARTYYGAQGGLAVPAMRYAVGTEIASLEFGLSLSPEAETLLRGYDTRLAPAEVHCGVFNADGTLLGFRRFFRGMVEEPMIPTAPQGSQAIATINLVSIAQRGTMTAAGHKSDASQRQRNAADGFRKDSDKGSIPSDPWGGDGG